MNMAQDFIHIHMYRLNKLGIYCQHKLKHDKKELI